ncbi:tumor necrosis factor receptor superfamily member 11B-like [Trichomycterus rosablanca]|uniref:tumor necrosis factor receptor superfamily member 11B-like n=1 Tax=Trichomycterus rosablanca TaxID=2290929 RepID=UPI002F3608D2
MGVLSKLSLVVLLFLVRAAATTGEPLTFDYEDPVNGGTLTCKLCPPGTHMYEPCTDTEETKCAPCPKNHFTEFWNYLPKCLYCSNFCTDKLMVEQECSATQNRVCRCKEGYYWQHYFCSKHTQCMPGFGAKIIGDAHRDTQCEVCPSGTFSAHTSSSAQCLNHTDCGKLLITLPGRTWHDNICVSCADLKNEGYIKIFRRIIPVFFTQKHVPQRKLRAAFLPNGQNYQQRSLNTRSSTFKYIATWTEKASHDQLKQLPAMLQRSGCTYAAQRLKRMLTRLEKVSKCHL